MGSLLVYVNNVKSEFCISSLYVISLDGYYSPVSNSLQ